jgi:hypothetical protein
MGIKGNLIDISLPDVFQVISIGKRSGKLVIRAEAGKANVIFDEGRIVQASIDHFGKNLGKMLIEKGFLNNEQLIEAIQTQKGLKEWKQLGTICVDLCYISKEQLEETVKSLITEIVMTMLTWKDGSFNFDSLDKKIDDDIGLDMRELIIRSGVSSDFVILEGARLLDEKAEELRKRKQEEISLRKEITGEFATDLLKDIDPSILETLADDKSKKAGRPSFPKAAAKIYSEIKSLKDCLERAKDNELWQEFSFSIMRFASEIASRIILFRVEGAFASGIAHMGVTEDCFSVDEEIRNLKIPLDKPSILGKAYQTNTSYLGDIEESPWNDYLIKKFSKKEPSEVFVMPIVLNGRIQFILYGDNYPGSDPINDIEELELFVYQAGMAMEITLLKKGA